jgi:hypothetical protein
MGIRTDSNDPCTGLGRIVQDALTHFVVQVCAVVVCFDGGAFGLVCVGVERVEVGADALYWGKILSNISKYGQECGLRCITWTRDAPVSSVLFFTLSGSPRVLLLVGTLSILIEGSGVR